MATDASSHAQQLGLRGCLRAVIDDLARQHHHDTTVTSADTASALHSTADTKGITMRQFLQGPDGQMNGSIGAGRDGVPAATEVDLSTFRAPEPHEGLRLSDALKELRAASTEFNIISHRYATAWTRYVAEEVARREPRAVIVWLDVQDEELLTALELENGEHVPVESVPGGEELVLLLNDYFDAVMPEWGIDVRRGVLLTEDADLDGLLP